MLSYLSLIALLASAFAGHLGLPMTQYNSLLGCRIVGGDRYNISQVPYQVSLQVGGRHSCGGSILNDRFILTASHCIIGNEANWNNMYVRVGASMWSYGGEVIKVKSFHSPPNYDASQNWINDIAILELSSPITFSADAQPVGLPAQGEALPIGKMATASGWGRLEQNGIVPLWLQGVKIPIQDPSVCEKAYGSSFHRNVQVCAASTAGGQSTCQGDSGGPLVYAGVQYGIVSWAVGCAAPNYPTVFAHLPNLRNFITEIVGL